MQKRYLQIVQALLVAILPTLASAGGPAQIQYIGIVRDFSQLHNDFEGIAGSDGPQLNMLYPYLNSKNQTIFRPPMMRTGSNQVINSNCYGAFSRTGQSTLANWGQFYWDEHYQDVPGVNIAMPVTLTMVPVNASDPANTLYTMDDQFYHPVNGKGYGLREQLDLVGPQSCCYSPANSSTIDINMWFTVEFTIPFYYRNQSEQFNFVGDDDLYVFINGRLVCDLGGIHSASPCSFTLSSSLTDKSGVNLNLVANTTNIMKIYYAERHTAGSHLKLTTSILPTNTPPVVYDSTVGIYKASSGSVVPRTFDADGNPIKVLFYNSPQHGSFTVLNTTTQVTSQVTNNTWYDLGTAAFTYAPTGLYVGQEQLVFTASDGFSLAANNATLTVNVINRDLPPVPMTINANVYSNVISYIRLNATDLDNPDPSLFQYATAANSACSLGGCTLPCVCNIDAYGNPTSGCLPNVLSPNNTAQASFLKYVPVNLGTDTLQYLAYDGTVWSTSSATISVTVTCDPTITKCTSAGDSSGRDPRNSNDNNVGGGNLAGIIAGAAVAGTLIAGALAYVAYYKLAATRFEKAWERDWAQAQISENPMYKSNVREAFNPLYVESAT